MLNPKEADAELPPHYREFFQISIDTKRKEKNSYWPLKLVRNHLKYSIVMSSVFKIDSFGKVYDFLDTSNFLAVESRDRSNQE